MFKKYSVSLIVGEGGVGQGDPQIPSVLKAVKNGQISEERIDESVKRIISVKLSLKK